MAFVHWSVKNPPELTQCACGVFSRPVSSPKHETILEQEYKFGDYLACADELLAVHLHNLTARGLVSILRPAVSQVCVCVSGVWEMRVCVCVSSVDEIVQT